MKMRGLLRSRVSPLTVGLILSLFLVTVGLAQDSAGFSGRMREITKNLENNLQEMMKSHAVRYSFVNTTKLPYNASTKFYPRGMGELYNFTNFFIDLIYSKQLYPQGLLTLKQNKTYGTTIRDQGRPNYIPNYAHPMKEWKMYVKHYGLLGIVVLAALLLAVVLPFVGLFFCCCRCAGNCGARSEPFDKKHDHCKKVLLNTFLIVVATVMLLTVVCVFVTNERVQDGTRELPSNIKHNLKDVSLYMTTTRKEIDVLLKVNFEELEVTLNNILQASGKIVTEQLAEYSHAVSLMNLNDIVTGLNDIRADLKSMNELTLKLRTNAGQLDNVIRGVRNSLLHTLNSCNSKECDRLKKNYKVNQMSVQVDFDKLPDVTSVLRNITLLMEDNIVAEVSKGKDSFMKIQRDIQNAVNQTIPVVSASIRRAGDSLAIIANNLTAILEQADFHIDRNWMRQLDLTQIHIDEYSPYRHYVGLAMSGVLLSVLTCVTFGLLCGICGKRPDGYDDDCCDKGNGARFLMMAVWLIFLLTSVMLILVVGHMLIGIAAERGVCQPLKNPKNNYAFNFVDEYIDIKRIIYPRNPQANISLKHIFTSCHANQTLFRVLMLDNMVDLNTLRSYIDRYDINKTIHQLRQKISLSPGVIIFSDAARQKLRELAESGLSDIKFYQYTENLRDNITNINLEQLSAKLYEVSSKLPNNQQDIKGSLDKNAFDLLQYHKILVLPMIEQSQKLSESAIKLQEHIKFNHTSMAAAIHELVKEVTAAQNFLNKDGPRYVQLLATKFGDAFISQIYSFLEHVINNTQNHIGKCGPLSNAFNATIVDTCNRIVDPFNGFWASTGFCLLLFIPTIILCVKLSGLYQKSDPYPGPLVDAEYLYDAYADRDRDNVPLAHVHDKKYAAHSRHHPGGGYSDSYEGPVHGYNERERMDHHHQGSSHHHHDSRYSDYAPKNWDFPNGGPPRYQPAAVAPPLSTEYERPPPYYYPGPVDRN